MILLAMDLLSSEALAGAGVSVGGLGLAVFTRFVFQMGAIKSSVDKFLATLTATLEAHNQHVKDAKSHQGVMEATQKEQVDIMMRLERSLSSAPRAVTGDHTPVPHHPGE